MRRMKPKAHQCAICQKSFARPSKLRHHVAFHHEKKYSFECTECGKPYSNQDHVNRHYRTVHSGETLPSRRFACAFELCARSFVNKQNLDRHVRLAHTQKSCKTVRCFYCSVSVESLESHLAAQHQSILPDQFKCVDCAKNFPSVKRLIHHRVTHTDERREVDVQWTMNRLLDEVDRREKLTCDLCDRVFQSLFQLDQHRHSKIHQTEFKCQFSDCGKTFLYMRNLQHHVRVHHEKLVRLSCPMQSCAKMFTCQASVCRHLSRCHSTDDILEQINSKRKQSAHQQRHIRRFLSGFNSRRLTEENDVSRQMKRLLSLLLTDGSVVPTPDESMETASNDSSFDPILLKGYDDLGLTEL